MIKRRKTFYPAGEELQSYLSNYSRNSGVPLVYDDLLRFTGSIPYENPAGEETLWLEVMYPPEIMTELRTTLTQIYAMLKIGGDLSLAKHLTVERIDFGEFGNSRPFRIRVTNLFNGNSDYYYVKHADASRIYGLELEHILSPNRINYLVNGNTLIEEHIAGVPGDIFIRDYLQRMDRNVVRIAKEFVKFGERCFMRLLGDMRSVNYVVDITPDFEEVQYRVRPIDFDQQSYEGSLDVYRSHLFPDNKPVEELVREHLNDQTIMQYRSEERSQMARRARAEGTRLGDLLSVMEGAETAPPEHIVQLAECLNDRYNTTLYQTCRTMGEIMTLRLQQILGYKTSSGPLPVTCL